jgi:4-aminobutyrate aminotransferase
MENFGVEPDIITSAKGIASGMPLGAVMARQSVMTWRPGQQGSTFGGNPLSCAAALATIDAIVGERMLENALDVGDYAMDVLKGIRSAIPSSAMCAAGPDDRRGICAGQAEEDHRARSRREHRDEGV